MSIRIYNSLTRKKEEFVPAKSGRVTMYVCGPTVYALSHIGHARSAVCFDAIFRYLKHTGLDVVYARNYTDVDDKIILRAAKEGITSEALAERNIGEFDADMEALGVELPTHRPRATETMDKIIEVTETLIARGFAYESGGDVFYSVRRFEGYGKLSGKRIDELEAGARIDVNEQKQDPLDFALWKKSKPGEPSWKSPWGEGRPGWHIECSAMCMEWLGETIDIHGGGKDLIFPHHENEIAQSEAASGKAPFAKYWLHNGFVNIEKEKMSKSLGNILNIRDALAVNTSEAVRHFLLSSHYRSPIDYTTDSLREAEAAVERYYKTLQRIEVAHPEAVQISPDEDVIKERLTPFTEAMDDDFNTATVLGNIFKEIGRANRLMDSGTAENLLEELSITTALLPRGAALIGIFRKTPDEYFAEIKGRSTIAPEEIERLIKERNEAREKKDFARADEIRDELLEKKIILEDTAQGTTWTVKG